MLMASIAIDVLGPTASVAIDILAPVLALSTVLYVLVLVASLVPFRPRSNTKSSALDCVWY